MARAQTELIDSGVDWITVTTKECRESEKLASWASEMLTCELRKGNLRKGWGMSGFSGIACGQVQLGKRNDECVVRLTGETAQRSWRSAYRLGDSVTRLDLQCTFRIEQDLRKFIRTQHLKADRYESKRKRPRRVRLITNNDGSDTLYLGLRTSNQFGRCYNKQVESMDHYFRNCVRFELQLNGKSGHLGTRRVARMMDDRKASLAYCSGFFRNRACSFPRFVEPLFNRIPRVRTTLESRLEWFQKQCQGSARSLVEFGMGQELLGSLGLSIDSLGHLVLLDHAAQKDS